MQSLPSGHDAQSSASQLPERQAPAQSPDVRHGVPSSNRSHVPSTHREQVPAEDVQSESDWQVAMQLPCEQVPRLPTGERQSAPSWAVLQEQSVSAGEQMLTPGARVPQLLFVQGSPSSQSAFNRQDVTHVPRTQTCPAGQCVLVAHCSHVPWRQRPGVPPLLQAVPSSQNSHSSASQVPVRHAPAQSSRVRHGVPFSNTSHSPSPQREHVPASSVQSSSPKHGTIQLNCLHAPTWPSSNRHSCPSLSGSQQSGRTNCGLH